MTRLEILERRLASWRRELDRGGPYAVAAPTAICLLEDEIAGLKALDGRPVAKAATRLSPAMRRALDRLCQNKVWADGRSVDALIRRGLVERRGYCEDALLGRFAIDIPTSLGREVNSYLVKHETA